MKPLTLFTQIIIYSLIPAVGVLFFGWDWREIIILFWLENITIGIQTVIGIKRTQNVTIDGMPLRYVSKIPVQSNVIKTFASVFFVLNYGFFTLMHGVFIFFFMSDVFYSQTAHETTLTPVNIFPLIILWLLASIVQIIRTSIQAPPIVPLNKQFVEPYRRIIPLHAAIIFGSFIVSTFNLPSAMALVLIALKLYVDINNYDSMLLKEKSN